MARTKIEDRVGQKFGRLTVLSVFSKPYKTEEGKWVNPRLLCRCECGKVIDVIASSVVSGNTKSCGCFNSEMTTRRFTTHSLSSDPLYSTWNNMRHRITNPAHPGYPWYGERGLTMEPEWVDDFTSFKTWVLDNIGPKPEGKFTIDRRDNEVGYLKGNLRWATDEEQNNNTRSNRFLLFLGRVQTMKQWCRELNLNYGAISVRLNALGWTVERALTTPTNRTKVASN